MLPKRFNINNLKTKYYFDLENILSELHVNF